MWYYTRVHTGKGTEIWAQWAKTEVIHDLETEPLFSCKIQNSKTITSKGNLICMEY